VEESLSQMTSVPKQKQQEREMVNVIFRKTLGFFRKNREILKAHGIEATLLALKLRTKLGGFSPQAIYTYIATAACRRS
jgi:hypothetical protein